MFNTVNQGQSVTNNYACIQIVRDFSPTFVFNKKSCRKLTVTIHPFSEAFEQLNQKTLTSHILTFKLAYFDLLSLAKYFISKIMLLLLQTCIKRFPNLRIILRFGHRLGS